MITLRNIALLAVACLISVACDSAENEQIKDTRAALKAPFKRGELVLRHPQNSAAHTFELFIADTPQTRAQGLMHWPILHPNEAMIFDWGTIDDMRHMWMKNTQISLDMLFVANGEVVHIARETTPFSHDIISSGVPVRYVIELAAGSAESYGIDVGWGVRWRASTSSEAQSNP